MTEKEVARSADQNTGVGWQPRAGAEHCGKGARAVFSGNAPHEILPGYPGSGTRQGRIKTYGVSAAWKKFSGNPNANFMIKYTKQSTDNALDADEAGELTAAKYGPGEWWLLLDPVMAQ